MFIALLNKVKTKAEPKIFRFFSPSEDHVNADEVMPGPSPGHFDRFPNFARTVLKISEYYPGTFKDF